MWCDAAPSPNVWPVRRLAAIGVVSPVWGPGPASAAFSDEYTKKFDQAPGTYSTEGYDLGTILAKGIGSGAVTREALLDYAKKYEGQGVARKYQWTDTGELTTTLIWIYKVQ